MTARGCFCCGAFSEAVRRRFLSPECWQRDVRIARTGGGELLYRGKTQTDKIFAVSVLVLVGALVLGGRGPYLHVLGSHHHPGVLWKTPHGGPWVRGAGGGAIARGSVGALLWDTRVMAGAMYTGGYGELEAKLALGAEQDEP